MTQHPFIMPRLQGNLAIAAALLAGAAFGLSACINTIYIFTVWFTLPLVWLAFPNRWIAALFILSFYFSVSWEIVPGLLNYIDWEWTIFWKAIGAWSLAAFIPTLPWLICFPNHAAHNLTRKFFPLAAALILLLILLTLPPLGVLIWGNPLTSAGLIYPGLAWISLIACALLICSTAVAFYVPPHRKHALITCGILLSIAAFAHISFSATKQIPKTWVAINTSSHFTGFDSYLIELIKEQLIIGKKVIILPENSVDIDELKDSISWQPLIKNLRDHQATLISGAYKIQSHAINLHQAFEKRHREGVLIISQDQISFYDTRQPLPLMSWLPFQLGQVSAFWWETGVYTVQNKKVGIFVCFEDFLPWMSILTMTDHPKVLVSIANHYWDRPSAINKQLLIFQIWGRLFNIPVLMAENL